MPCFPVFCKKLIYAPGGGNSPKPGAPGGHLGDAAPLRVSENEKKGRKKLKMTRGTEKMAKNLTFS